MALHVCCNKFSESCTQNRSDICIYFMMNVLRTISYISCRTYSRRAKNIGISGKLQMSKRSGLKFDIDEVNCDDLDEFEAEYMNADKFYDIHEWEKESSKEKLKNTIVATKYFKKDKDPNFLTTIEKHEIRKLYKSNPEEWTIEKLSESFPALPETIKKILKSNWPLLSVEQVLRNDATVINNWKQFQAGKLPLSPDLQKHLVKFKNREIVLPDRDLLAKTLISPKRELPKPRSIFFSKIVQSYLDQNKSNQCNNISLQDGEETIVETNILNNIKNKNVSKNICNKENLVGKEILDNNNKLMITENKNSLEKKVCNAKLTWNEFAKKELPKIYDDCPVEGIVLLNVYKKYLQSQNSLPNNIEENTSESKHIETAKKEMTAVAVEENDTSQLVSAEKLEANLSTYIKARMSKIAEHETYPLPIKIPKNIYKKGKTYRICDCYYDDDGQFLYRIPGLRN